MSLASLLFVAACAGKVGDGGSSHCADASAPAAPAPAAGPGANAADVARFADEEPLGPAAVTAHDNTSVRKAPGSSALVTTLPATTEVTKLSAHGGDVLVSFNDPKGREHLIGWVAAADLQEPSPPSPAEPDGGDEPPPHHGGHHHGGKHHRHHPP